MTDLAERELDDSLLEQVTLIVSAFVSNNALSPADLPKLIADTHSALQSLSGPEILPVTEDLKPAVAIKKSVTPDFIICLDDGMKFKSMKRHLTGLGMTPDDYRTKWGLASDYPMVAPNYAATRSALARSNGLGRKPAQAPEAPATRTKKPKIDA
jgi:predicted transcriptional regulator